MKRIVLFIGVLVCLSLSAMASGRRFIDKADGKTNVVTTIFPPYDFVREIAGDKVNLTMLLPPGAESHSFEPTPQDIIKIQNADVFIYVGGESDAWVERILKSMDTSRMSIISLMDCVAVVEEEIVEGMQDEEEGHDHGHSHEEESFTIADVKDRALTDWAGEWQSVYPHLLDGTLDPVMEHKAEEGEKTARDYYEQYKTAYATAIDKVSISADSMTFYINGVPTRAQYAYRGTGIIAEDDGSLWVRYKFEAVGSPSKGAPKYIMFSDHLHAPAKTEHFHIYASDKSFDELMADTNPTNYPTYYPASLTKNEIVAEMIGHDHAEEVEYDEHVWTAPQNAKLIVRKIAAVLKERDGANAAVYESNTTSYLAKLDELDASFQELVRSAKRRTMVFGDRFPFRYFADAYGLSYFAAFPGCSTETEASAATIAFLINKIRAEKIPAVFHIELSNEKIADILCEETGAQKMLLHAVHNVSKRDFDGGASYYTLMSRNIQTLREALY
ncbi:MAG: zinc ABC transporter substrate-binding protein [Spirochaetaceae bacterium]|jgi:zinc transport system substrate-binding protein|nr:zinc ABC transporter substrate-binding protein [Spirochaetaceae bacterium]